MKCNLSFKYGVICTNAGTHKGRTYAMQVMRTNGRILDDMDSRETCSYDQCEPRLWLWWNMVVSKVSHGCNEDEPFLWLSWTILMIMHDKPLLRLTSISAWMLWWFFQQPRRNRQRSIIWFNPPFSKSVKTNIGPHHKLPKILTETHAVIKISNIVVAWTMCPSLPDMMHA